MKPLSISAELDREIKGQYLAALRAQVGKRLWEDSQKEYFVTPTNAPLFQAVSSYTMTPPCLVLSGPPGVGKSHLAVWKAREIIEQRCIPVEFVPVTTFLRSLGGLFPSEALTLMLKMQKCRVLVLDDLPPVREERSRRDLLELVDARYRHERATIVTTNIRPEEFDEALGPQIASRLLDTHFSCVAVPGGRS